MDEITIAQAHEKTRTWQKGGVNWHFHVLFPDCIFNKRGKQYAMVLEDHTSAETFVVYSDIGFAKDSQQFLKLLYGNEILVPQNDEANQEKPENRLLTQVEVFNQNKVLWHHHMLFPECIFNDHPGKWNIVLEGRREVRTYNAVYDNEPINDFKQLEIEYFKEIDPTFHVE